MNYLMLAAALIILATPVLPQSTEQRQCGPRPMVVERLANKFGETRRSIGLAGRDTVIEVYASDETGSWTIVATVPSGVSCLVASGQFYEELTEIAPAKGNDA